MRHVRISSETTSVMGTIKTSDFNSKKINKSGQKPWQWEYLQRPLGGSIMVYLHKVGPLAKLVQITQRTMF